MDTSLQSKILSVLAGAKDMTIATNRTDGYPQATIVGFVNDRLTIYFCCPRGSQKFMNILRDDKVSLAIGCPYERWEEVRGISAGGRAQEVDDVGERIRIRALMQAKFRRTGAFDANAAPSFALVRVEPEIMVLLDYRSGRQHTQLVLREDAGIDWVEEAGLESFPASDSPAWTGTTVR